MSNWTDTWGPLVFAGILYLAYQLGRLKGRWEALSGRAFNKKTAKENIEKADYEEIK